MITARKRSLGQGNVFTSVCHSVYREGGSAQPPGCKSPVDAEPPGLDRPPWMQMRGLLLGVWLVYRECVEGS